jgi:hypothetical protein
MPKLFIPSPNQEKAKIFFTLVTCKIVQNNCNTTELPANAGMGVPPTEPTAVKIWRWASENVCE